MTYDSSGVRSVDSEVTMATVWLKPESGFCPPGAVDIVYVTSSRRTSGWKRIAIAVQRFIQRMLLTSAMSRMEKVLKHNSPVMTSLWKSMQDPEEIPATGPKTRAHSQTYPKHYAKCKHPPEALYPYGNQHGKFR